MSAWKDWMMAKTDEEAEEARKAFERECYEDYLRDRAADYDELEEEEYDI